MEIILRPFALLFLLGSAWFIARAIKPLIPEGRVKQILFRKHELVPTKPSSPAVQWTCGIIIAIIVVLIVFKPLALLRQ